MGRRREIWYPAPTRISWGNGGPAQQRAVDAAQCKSGGFNSVYLLDGSLALRTTSSSEPDSPADTEAELVKEGALMRVLARLGVHPTVYAQTPSDEAHAPRGYLGHVFSTLMQRETPLRDFLKSPAFDGQEALLPTLERTLFLAICKAADLGLCLLDLRPENVLCLLPQGICHIIDLGGDYCVWMDEQLLELFKDGEERARQARRVAGSAGSACAKVRGVQLYLMLLLMHRHLTQVGSPRAVQLAALLAPRLTDSCIPIDLIRQLFPRRCEGDERVSLGEILACRLHRYFKERSSSFLRDYVTQFGLLRRSQCSGKALDVVVVAGRDYSRDDSASCFGTRTAVLRSFAGRPYPCVDRLPRQQFIIDEQGQASLLLQRLRSRSEQVPLNAPALRVDFGNVLSPCSKASKARIH